MVWRSGSGKATIYASIGSIVFAAAAALLEKHHADGAFVTGLIYMNEEAESLHERLGTAHKPLNVMDEAELCPGSSALERINASLR